jgi:hypothetical protein
MYNLIILFINKKTLLLKIENKLTHSAVQTQLGVLMIVVGSHPDSLG